MLTAAATALHRTSRDDDELHFSTKHRIHGYERIFIYIYIYVYLEEASSAID